ncbi:MAG TPA: hypothetical protein VGS21_06800 [Acidimicrobiales bacterium]|nr:hypothetical protein [Acidimicrobiales bacterium]
MRTAVTVGFAVEEVDRARLDHLADVFGAGSRSSFLRAAMTVMEQVEQVGRRARVRAYGAERLAGAGYTVGDIPDIVEHALLEPDLEAAAQAALVSAAIRRRRPALIQDSAGCDDQVDAESELCDTRSTTDSWAPTDERPMISGFVPQGPPKLRD